MSFDKVEMYAIGGSMFKFEPDYDVDLITRIVIITLGVEIPVPIEFEALRYSTIITLGDEDNAQLDNDIFDKSNAVLILGDLKRLSTQKQAISLLKLAVDQNNLCLLGALNLSDTTLIKEILTYSSCYIAENEYQLGIFAQTFLESVFSAENSKSLVRTDFADIATALEKGRLFNCLHFLVKKNDDTYLDNKELWQYEGLSVLIKYHCDDEPKLEEIVKIMDKFEDCINPDACIYFTTIPTTKSNEIEISVIMGKQP